MEQLCGRRMCDDVELKSIDPFYKIRFADGSTFAYSADRAAMRAEVERFFARQKPTTTTPS